MGSRKFADRSLRIAFALSAGALSVAAQGVRVSAPLERVTIAGEVREVALDADGKWLAYLNVLDDAWTDEARLFALRAGSGDAPELLTAALGRGSTFALTPDGEDVVFSDPGGRGVVPGLYRVPSDGSREPVRISPLRGAFTFDREGTRVVFSDDAPGGLGLFVAPLDGSAAPLVLAGTDAFGPRVSPAGDRVVFLARGAGSAPDELYGVPIDGSSAPVQLNVTPVPFGDVLEFAITPDGTRVVYRADQDLDLADELYSVPIDGSAPPVKLNVPLPRRQQDVTAFRISPDGAHVVYRADQDVIDVFELFGVPVAGGVPPTKLSGAMTAGGDVAAEFEIDPSGRHVLYVADAAVDQRFDLHQVDLLGLAAPRRVSGELVDGGDVVQFWIDPRGGRVVYRADQVTDGVFGLFYERLGRPAGPIELAPSSGPDVRLGGGYAVFTLAPHLFSVPVDGSGPVERLDPELAPGGTVRPDFRIEPDGAHVLFRADLETAGLAELLRVPIAGGVEPQRLSAPTGVERIVGAVESVRVSADSSRIAYGERVSGNTDSTRDKLFVRPLDPAADATLLFPTAPSHDDDAGHLLLSADSSHVLYSIGDEEGERFPALFSVPSDAHVPSLQLNTPSQSDYGIGWIVTTPDGRTAVWSEDGGSRGIYAAPVDGSAPALQLAAGVDEGQPYSFLLSPPGTSVVYLEPLAPASSEARLMSVPVDGGSAPVPLNAPVAPRGSRGPFRITPDGSRVVYRTDQDVDEVHELYVVPVDGSAAPVKLSGTLVAGGDVQSFQLDAAGTKAVFLADRLVDGELELFAVPLDASAEPVALSDLPGADRTTLDHALAPDGQRVVFRSDLVTAGAIELWSAPTDGSAAPVRLSGALVEGGRVQAFLIAPDGERVVYVADQRVDERFELFGAPIDGSAPPVVLSGPFLPGSDVVGAFAIRADSRQVVYVADPEADDVFELFGAPLDRAKASVRLSGPMVAGGDVRPTSFVLTPDGRAVLYVADQEIDDAFELYLSALETGRARRAR